MLKLRGVNLDKYEIFWDFCTSQKHYAYIVMLWGLRCVDEYVRVTVRERCCEKYEKKTYVHVYGNKLGQLYEKEVVRKTLWEWCCEHNVVRIMMKGKLYEKMWKKTLWKRRCEKDVVRKMLWEKRCKKNHVRKTLWERLYLMVLKPRYRLCPCFISRY